MARTTADPISAGLSATSMPAALQGCDFLVGRPFAARDDCAGVPHAFSGRSRATCDKRSDGLGHVTGDECRRLFLRRAANLADHQNRFGLIVVFEQL